MRLKVEKEKLKEKGKQNDKEYLEKNKNKMLAVKNKNSENEKEFNVNINRDVENKDIENNQKMEYLYSSKEAFSSAEYRAEKSSTSRTSTICCIKTNKFRNSLFLMQN